MNLGLLDPELWQSRAYWTEIFSAFMLALATVAGAYSVWQSTQWGGRQALLLAQASIDRLESSKALSTANSQTLYDTTVLGLLVPIYREGNTEAFLRIKNNWTRDEFLPALDAWLALDPVDNPDIPRTPFEMEEYTSAAQEEARRLEDRASAKFETATEANRISDDYVLGLVFFASVLFFAGIATKFNALSARIVLLTLASLFLVVGAIHSLRLPFL